jgi:hypothetical protein
VSPTFILAATTVFGVVFLASGIWFFARTENVASFDKRWSQRIPSALDRRKPCIGSRSYKIMFKAIGLVFITLGATLLIMAGLIVRGR